MRDITEAIAKFRKHRQQWQKFLRSGGNTRLDVGLPSSHLKETTRFGSNPGALRMFTHIPTQLAEDRALVVVLHGCTQTASSYDLGAGWSTLADRFGFALLFPEQQRANNPNNCFNWFNLQDTQRGQGEALSIRQMVDQAVRDHGIDPDRVYVTGLSAGGAMCSVMLATYPEVFAGGAIIAGLPYRAATNVQQAFESMFQSPQRSAREWGDLVRNATSHEGPWPRVSVWHGGSDATVIPTNALEIVKQWTDLHGVATAVPIQSVVDGYPRRAWLDSNGVEIIESYTIPGMAHGTPLSTGDAPSECGASGPFLLDVGISSSYHIAKFFGLTVGNLEREMQTADELLDQHKPLSPGKENVASVAPYVHEGEILGPGSVHDPSLSHSSQLPIDVGAVIRSALSAAGLMKRM